MEHLDLIQLISNLGFPIFVSWYLLTRVESRIETLTASITAMTQAIQSQGTAQKET
ncbi:YvrJ family protein [Ammoniphilus oxalaticus]|uniref:YvrJ family protein n=1 Tax=Ammoniphilus oxalaticus TaxID=66863 RepID=UPI000E719C15|nr:YvrJ family protein [Ammoniphilus oxalaticus]